MKSISHEITWYIIEHPTKYMKSLSHEITWYIIEHPTKYMKSLSHEIEIIDKLVK